MKAAILNSAMLDGFNTLLFLHKNTLTPLWLLLKLIQSDSNSFILTQSWWWQPSWILPSWIQPFCTNLFKLIHSHSNLMMAAILNSAILDSTILHKINFTHSIWLNLMMQPSWILPSLDSEKHCHSWIQTPCYHLSDSLKNTLTPRSDSLLKNNSILTQTHSFSPNLMMAAILNSANLNSAILDSAILVETFLSNSLTLAWRLVPSHLHRKSFTHSFWLNLMMAAILNSAILDSAFCTKLWIQTNSLDFILLSHSTWWWQPSWILQSWIQPFCTKLWLKLIQFDSLILDDGSHLEFCHLGFNHLSYSAILVFTHTCQTGSLICTKKNWLNIDSHH